MFGVLNLKLLERVEKVSDTELLDKFERIIMKSNERFVLRCCHEKYGNLREAIENVMEEGDKK